MTTTHDSEILDVNVVSTGVEVLTTRTPDGEIVYVVHGGKFDGEEFPGGREPDEACLAALSSVCAGANID